MDNVCIYSTKPFPVQKGDCVDVLFGNGSRNYAWIEKNCCQRSTKRGSKLCGIHRKMSRTLSSNKMNSHNTKNVTSKFDTLSCEVIAIIYGALGIHEGIKLANTCERYNDIFMIHYGVVPSGECEHTCTAHMCKYNDDDCTNRAIDGTSTCIQHKCIKVHCVNPVEVNSKYCFHHKYPCKIDDCNDVVNRKLYAGCITHYCTTHVKKRNCAYDNCKETIVNNCKSLFCSTHGCGNYTCLNARYSSTTYCKECTCAIDNCINQRVKYAPYCATHKCSGKFDQCKNRRNNGSQYCNTCRCNVDDCINEAKSGYFLCVVHKCSNLVCYNRHQQNESKLCVDCTCIKCGSGQKIYNSKYCVTCKCANTSCNEDRTIRGSKYCINCKCANMSCNEERTMCGLKYFSKYCITCKCADMSCDKERLRNGHKFCAECACKNCADGRKLGYLDYCSKCKCNNVWCKISSLENEQHCVKCSINGCHNLHMSSIALIQLDDGSILYKKCNLCETCKCSHVKCYNAKDNNKEYCSYHSLDTNNFTQNCVVNNCKHTRINDSEYYINHKCNTKECKNRRKFGLNCYFCDACSCTIDGCYECRCVPLKYCKKHRIEVAVFYACLMLRKET